jgi:hypothetical protein
MHRGGGIEHSHGYAMTETPDEKRAARTEVEFSASPPAAAPR